MATRDQIPDDNDIMSPSDMGKKLVVALRSVSEPQAVMQAIADRATIQLRQELITRIDSMERATSLWHDDLVRVPTEVQKSVGALRELIEQSIMRARAELEGEVLKEVLKNRGEIKTLSSLSEERFNQQLSVANKMPISIKDAVENLQQLHEEKFQGLNAIIESFKDWVNARFTLSDVQTEKAARDVKSAVDAAFAAAKEAVGEQNKSNALSITKSETAFTKQIDQMNDLIKTMGKSIDDKIESNKKTFDDKVDDLKTRLVGIEGRASVADPHTIKGISDLTGEVRSLATSRDFGNGEDHRSSNKSAYIIAVIGISISVVVAVVALVSLFVTVLHFGH